jgi:ATP-binding cassette subfamily C protein LapB
MKDGQGFVRKISPIDKFYLVFSTLMTTLLGLVLPFSILIIFDRILPNQSTNSLFLLFGLILISITLDYFLKTQEEKVTSLVMKRFESQLSNRVFQAICFSNIAKYNKLEIGQYLERITTIPEIKSFFGGESIKAFINSVTSLITIIIIFAINLGAGITLLFASISLLLAAKYLSNKRILLLEKRSNTEGMTNSKIIEIVTSPLEVKSRTMEYRFESLMNSMIDERESHSIEFERLESSFTLTLSLIQQISVAVVVVMCATAVIKLQISQGVMAAVILLTNRYFSPYQQVMRTFSRWKLNKMHIHRVSELLELEERSPTNKETILNPQIIREIHIVKPNGDDILLKSGKCFQFSGPTGCGKSHLTRCLTLEQKDDDTSIIVNGKSLTNIDYAQWKQIIARVDRNSTLVEGTIIENLTCFSPHLNNAAYSLCANLGVKQQIDQLKNGFYTQLRGNTQNPFSRQVNYSLLIIRALLSNKKIIIIDDLDMYFDKKFAQQLISCITNKADKTIYIVVSNKLSQIQHNLVRIDFKSTASDKNAPEFSVLEGIL